MTIPGRQPAVIMRDADRPDLEGVADVPVADGSLPAVVTDAKSLTADEAAEFLHVSLATLRAWERQFGFPASLESEHADRDYLICELLALRDALSEALSVSSAIHTARRHLARTP